MGRLHHASHEPGVARIVRVNGHRAVTEHGLGPGRGDDDLAHAVDGLAVERVSEVPHLALHLAGLDLEVGDGGLEVRVPVHQPLVAVDQALGVQLHKHLAHRRRQAVVQGEALPAPVARGAEPSQLLGDGPAGLGLPGPDAVHEGVAAHVAAALVALGGELALHHHLGGDAGVVGAGEPQHRLALHAVVAGEDVLQRGVQRMADVQRARDVGRRDDHAEGIGLGVARQGLLRAEGAGGFPAGVEAGFRGLGVEGLLDHGWWGKARRGGRCKENEGLGSG